jgi:AraC family transcriptional regulator
MKSVLQQGAYGDRLARYAHLQEAPTLDLTLFNRPKITITRLNLPEGLSEPSNPISPEPAFTVATHLFRPDCRGWGTWVDGKFNPVLSWSAGGIGIYWNARQLLYQSQ